MSRDHLITRPEVLDADFQPQEIVHRDGQLDYLKSILDDVRSGYRADGAFIHGPSGVGKTVTTKHIVEHLEDSIDGDEPHSINDIETAHFDCWGDDYSGMLHRLLDAYDSTIIHHENTRVGKLQETFNKEVTKPYVVVLDEVDQLKDDTILYRLHENRNVTMLLVANADDEFFDHLEPRVYSRLRQYPSVEFPKYKAHQLVSILNGRVEAGIRPGAIDETRLREIVDVSDNDARMAIGLLENAVQEADDRGLDEVTSDVIYDEAPETKQAILSLSYSKLTARQRILYEILVLHGEQQKGEIHDRYAERVDDPRSPKTIQKDLKKMCHYYVAEPSGDNKGRTYRATTDRLLDEAT